MPGYLEFFSLLATLIGMFFWNRSESRADIRHMDAKLESTRELVRAIHTEMKDFHARLCAIEERNRGK
jgi:hypothetical protein